MFKLRKGDVMAAILCVMIITAVLVTLIPLFTVNKSANNVSSSAQNVASKQKKDAESTKNTSTISINKNIYVVNLLSKNDIKYSEFDKILNSLNPKFKDIYNKRHKQIVVVVGNRIDSNAEHSNIEVEQATKNTLNNNSHISKLIVYDNVKNKLFYANKSSKVEVISANETQFISWCTKLINDENTEYNKTLHEKSICINIIGFLVVLDILLILFLFMLKNKAKKLNNVLFQ